MAHNNSSYCFEYFSWDVEFAAFSIVINGVITVLTVIFGCVGNIYSIHTIKKLRISKALALYLVILLIFDTGVLLCSMGYYGIHAFIKIFHMRFKYLPYFTQILNGPSSTAMTGSIWMVIVITVSRYSAVSNPLRHRAAETKHRAQTISCVAIIFAFTYSLPHYFEFVVMPCIHGEIFQPWYSVRATSMRLSPIYQYIYKVTLNFIFVSVAPFMLILVLSIRMLLLVRRSLNSDLFEGRSSPLLPNRKTSMANQKSSVQNRQQHVERKTSTMLIGLLVKFLICYSLSIVLNLVEVFQGHQVTGSVYFILVTDVSNWLVVLNSATNCIIYFWSGHKSRGLQRDLTTSMSMETIAFTRAEIVTLRRGWKRAVEKKGTICSDVLTQMVPDESSLAISNTEHSQKMEKFFNDLLSCLDNKKAAQDLCQSVAFSHIDMNNMSIEMWSKFKPLIIVEVLGVDSTEFRQLIGSHNTGPEAREAQIWNKFLDFITGEMRKFFVLDRKFSGTSMSRTQSSASARELITNINSF